jgi:hypothetical protein
MDISNLQILRPEIEFIFLLLIDVPEFLIFHLVGNEGGGSPNLARLILRGASKEQ